MTEVRTIAVLGAGDMGHGVAELAAIKGFDVHLRDVDAAILEAAMKKVRWSLDKLAKHATLTPEQANEAFERILPTTNLRAAVGDADLIIEAVPEKLDLKRRVFAEVEAAARPTAILASNTSALRIQEIAADLRDPKRVVGMHFFNPVLLMDLVEVIPGLKTSPEAVAIVESVAKRMGKTTVTLSEDTPGFVTSRLISLWVGAAILAHDHKLGTKEAIDSAMRFKAGFPMGPFELADYTGLDVGYHASAYLATVLGPDYNPSPTLANLVERGHLGKKTGRGFYEWKDNRMTTTLTPDMGKDFDPAIILAVVANEAAKLIDDGVASADEIDLAMRNGCAFPKGPLEWADEQGLDTVAKMLYTLEEQTGEPLVSAAEPFLRRVESGRLGRKTGEGFYKHAAAPAAAAQPAPEPAPAPAAAPEPEPVDPAAEPTVAAAVDSKAEPAAAKPEKAAPVATIREYETILVEVDADKHVATITLDRPHRLHAINGQLLADLDRAFSAMETRDDVRVIVLTGSGDKAFCAGADLAGGEFAGPARTAQLARIGHMLCIRMEKSTKPIVAAINGVALGGGLELSLPADFRVCATRAKFALPEVTLGLLPAMGGTQRLPKLIGLARAKEVALLGERFDAMTALQYGLVARVYPNETFREDAHAFAADLATRAPLALAATKQLLNMAPTTDILAGMEAEAHAFALLTTTDDMIEGVSSMFAKKKPVFEGK